MVTKRHLTLLTNPASSKPKTSDSLAELISKDLLAQEDIAAIEAYIWETHIDHAVLTAETATSASARFDFAPGMAGQMNLSGSILCIRFSQCDTTYVLDTVSSEIQTVLIYHTKKPENGPKIEERAGRQSDHQTLKILTAMIQARQTYVKPAVSKLAVLYPTLL